MPLNILPHLNKLEIATPMHGKIAAVNSKIKKDHNV